ncbi:unnamed protein product [Rhizophagus irregularis]|nr:unnamed protein product [Rhizophagus irregularis]
MFILSVLKDTIHIQPYDFYKSKYDALADEINRIYANKVIQEVGLCICLFDILSASEEIVHYGNGASYAKVKFQLVVFRPFIGEILEGKVSSNTPEGVKVTLGYFDDILIPTNNDDGWRFDFGSQVWVRLWDNPLPENLWKSAEDKYFIYGPPPKRTGAVAGQKVPQPGSSSLPSDVMIVGNNKSVTNIQPPNIVNADTTTGSNVIGGANATSVQQESKLLGAATTSSTYKLKQAPYEIVGSIAEVGLGLTSWAWD